MLSYPGYHVSASYLVVLELTRMVVKWRHCYVNVTSPCEIASERIQGLLEAYFNIKNRGEQEKESIIHVRVG